jgi:hypothetical protein
MTKLERIEKDVQALSPEELADFRKWFMTFDGVLWDRQFAGDVQAGKLDQLRDEARSEHAAHRTREL